MIREHTLTKTNFPQPIIIIIAAMDKLRLIGSNGKLPWNLPEEMKHFRETTRDSTVIMGSKTFLSIGKPLPKRVNIVITRDVKSLAQIEGIIVVSSPQEAIIQAQKFGKKIFIIGGAQIYTQFLTLADTMYLSIVEGNYSGDSYFPEFIQFGWKEVNRTQKQGFEVVEYTRNII